MLQSNIKMEYQKILNLLSEARDSKFVTRKWNFVNDQSNGNYDVWNEIIYNTEVLTLSCCNYSDIYILVRGDITIVWDKETQVAFKNYAPFRKCITKIDVPTIDDYANELDLAMPTYKLLEYNSNYSDVASSLWFYSKERKLILKMLLQTLIILNLSIIKLNY